MKNIYIDKKRVLTFCFVENIQLVFPEIQNFHLTSANEHVHQFKYKFYSSITIHLDCSHCSDGMHKK